MTQEEMLTTADVARELGITIPEVRSLIRSNALFATKNNRKYQIPHSALNDFKSKHANFQTKPLLPKDTGILQITFGLTGVSAVVMTLLPSSVADVSPIAKVIILFISLVVALFSLIASLILLGQHLEAASLLSIERFETLPYDLGYILALFTSATVPYWLLATSLFLLVVGLIIVSFFTLAYG